MFEELSSLFNLGAFSKEERNLMKEQRVNYRKSLGKTIKESKKLAKLERCYYCDNPCSSFCNSHSIPAFCLRNIAVAGDVYCLNALVDFPLIDHEKGVGEAGTFQLICRDCDSKIFADYENPDNYLHQPTPKMITQIALKNYLKFIYKRLLEEQMYDVMCSRLNLPEQVKNAHLSVNKLDLDEYINGYMKTKRMLEKNRLDGYYICYYEKLNYVVPIAFQSPISLIIGFNGEIINEVYNPSPEYCVKPIHICIFPLETESVIIMFIENGDNRYRKFYKQFGKLSLADRLETLTFIIFAYSEDMFYSKKISNEVLRNTQLKSVGEITSEIMSITPFVNPYKKAAENFDLTKRIRIPNLLSEEYKIST